MGSAEVAAWQQEEMKLPTPTWHWSDCARAPNLQRGHLLCLQGTSSLLFEVWTPASDTAPLLRVLVWGGKMTVREWLKQILLWKTASNVFLIAFSIRLVLAPCSS